MEQKKNKNTAFTRPEIEQHLQSALASATPDLWPKLNAAVLEESLSEEKTRKTPEIIRRTFTGWAAAAAACICLMCGGGYYHYEYLQVISEVEIDVNPSLKLSVNRKDQVVKAQALNEDGVQLVDSAQLKGRKLEEAVGHVVDSLVEQGYFREDQKEHAILVSVSGRSEEKAEKLKTAVTADVEQALSRQEVKAVVYDQVIQVTDELQELADTYQVSLGKAEFIGQLVSENDSLSQDQEEAYSWLMGQTMESLAQEIHQNEYQISSGVTVIKTEPAVEGKSRREQPSGETEEKSRELKTQESGQEPDQKEQEAEEAGDQTAGNGEKSKDKGDVRADGKAEEKPGKPEQLKGQDKKNTEQPDREEGQTEEDRKKEEAEEGAESPEKETAPEKETGGQDSLNQEGQKPDSQDGEAAKEEIAGEEPAKAGQKESKEGSESEARRKEVVPESSAESQEEEPESSAESQEEEPESSAESQEGEAGTSAESREGEPETSVESQGGESGRLAKDQEGKAESSVESYEEEAGASAESGEEEAGTSAESREGEAGTSAENREGEQISSAEVQKGEAEISADDQKGESESFQEERGIQPEAFPVNQEDKTGPVLESRPEVSESFEEGKENGEKPQSLSSHEEPEASSGNQDGQEGDFQDEEKMPEASDPGEQDENAGGQAEEEDVPDSSSRVIRMPSDEIDTFEPGDMASQPEKDSVTVTSSGTQIIFEAVEEVVWEEPVYASQLLTGSQRRLLHKGPGAFFNPVSEEEQEGFLYLGPGFMSLYGESVIDINQTGPFKEVRIRPLKGQVYRVTK